MIVIVSGLPRSGTSLMMQMLQAGGVKLLTDQMRQPDDDNPRGYYEFEQVKLLKDDSTWLAGAEGKAVKVISMLLPDLPAAYHYKVVFMMRDMDEILASQRRMLERSGVISLGPTDAKMCHHLERHLVQLRQFLAQANYLDTLWCHYNELLRCPREMTDRLVNFLNINLDQSSMVAVIDPTLYRQRPPC